MDVYLVLDMATVRLVRSSDGLSVSALNGAGELIAVVDVPPGTDEREVALMAFDAALERARLTRTLPEDPTTRVRCRVALYNPYTTQVAVGALPNTRAYTDGSPLALPPAGALATVDEDHMTIGARRLDLYQATRASLTRAYTAHEDSPRRDPAA